MNNYGHIIGTSDSIYGFLCALRLEYQDDAGDTQYIRLHNWSEDTVTIFERDNDPNTGTQLGNQTFTSYPFQIPGITTEASSTLPNMQVSLPITSTLTYILKSNINYVLGKPVSLYITTKDINAVDYNNYVLFRYFLNNISMNDTTVALDLNVRFNVGNLTLPLRKIRKNYCPFVYKDGINCTYNPDHADLIGLEVQKRCWDANSKPITVDADGVDISAETGTSSVNTAIAYAITADICGKSLYDCKLRRGATQTHDTNNPVLVWELLPFGGFPAVPSKDPRRLSV